MPCWFRDCQFKLSGSPWSRDRDVAMARCWLTARVSARDSPTRSRVGPVTGDGRSERSCEVARQRSAPGRGARRAQSQVPVVANAGSDVLCVRRPATRYDDRGPRYDDRGPRYDDRGTRYDDAPSPPAVTAVGARRGRRTSPAMIEIRLVARRISRSRAGRNQAAADGSPGGLVSTVDPCRSADVRHGAYSPARPRSGADRRVCARRSIVHQPHRACAGHRASADLDRSRVSRRSS